MCACGSDKTYSGAIADYEQAISRDQIKNSVSQASNPAGIKARTSDLKFKGTEMHQDFLAAILAQTDKLSFLKHCRELKAVDQFYSDFEVLDPDALALPHLWPLYDLLAEVFLNLSRPSSDHGANHFARFFEPPDPHKSLADYQSHIKPAVDYLQALQITDAAVLRDHLEAVSIINFITTCAHCKTSPKDISAAYLDVQRKIEAEQARDTTPITMQRFLPFKEVLRLNLRSVNREDGTWGLPSMDTGKNPLTVNRFKALEKENLKLMMPIYGASNLKEVLGEAVVRIVVEVDAVVDAVVHMVLPAGVAVASAVVQALMNRNHASVLSVAFPSI